MMTRDFIFLEEPVDLDTWLCMFEQVRCAPFTEGGKE